MDFEEGKNWVRFFDCKDCIKKTGRISELERENARLRGALEKYGYHEPDCAFFDYAEDADCSCG